MGKIYSRDHWINESSRRTNCLADFHAELEQTEIALRIRADCNSDISAFEIEDISEKS